MSVQTTVRGAAGVEGEQARARASLRKSGEARSPMMAGSTSHTRADCSGRGRLPERSNDRSAVREQQNVSKGERCEVNLEIASPRAP